LEIFILYSAVKEVWKSVKIWESYCQKFGGLLYFGTRCSSNIKTISSNNYDN